uniref:Uncharacterized protein n=1 Tax=Anopheles atroparvus TaxID=41427 RepID=A0AAG5DD63_ANOAO
YNPKKNSTHIRIICGQCVCVRYSIILVSKICPRFLPIGSNRE